MRPFFLPSPSDTLSSLIRLVQNGSLLRDLATSLGRVAGGFLISLIIALPAGLAIGLSKRADALIEPTLNAVRYVPPSAFIPLAILWLGIGEAEKLFIIVIGIAPYLVLLITDAVMAVRREFIESAVTLGADNVQLITRVILPSALPAIWDASRVMMGAAWTFLIIAEIVGASSGLGHMMVEAQRFLKTSTIFAGIITVGAIGLVTDALFKLGYRALFPWTEKGSSHAHAP